MKYSDEKAARASTSRRKMVNILTGILLILFSEYVLAVESNWRLPGMYYDAESGLYYNGQRYYDPEVGQYTSPERMNIQEIVSNYSVQNTASLLYSYQYANSNPIVYLDPQGKAAIQVFATVVGATTGAVNAWGNGGNVTEILGGAAIGAFSGLGTSLGIGNPALVGSIVGGISSAIGQKIAGKRIDLDDVFLDAFIGGLSGVSGAGLEFIGFTAKQALTYGAFVDVFFVGTIKAQASTPIYEECDGSFGIRRRF